MAPRRTRTSRLSKPQLAAGPPPIPRIMGVREFLETLGRFRVRKKVYDRGTDDIIWDDNNSGTRSTYDQHMIVSKTVSERLRLPNPVPYPYVDDSEALTLPRKPWPYVRNIETWDDFTMQTFRSCLPHIYDREDPVQAWDLIYMAHEAQDYPFLSINWNARRLHRTLEEWPISEVNEMLEISVQQMFQDLGVSADFTMLVRISAHWHDRHRFPDFGLLKDENDIRRCILVGDIKASQHWRFEEVQASSDWQASDSYSPLRQVAYYARTGGTRYGVILTEKEIVVLEFWKVGQHCDGKEILDCRFVRAGWETHGADPSEMTVQEALFSIALLCLYDQDREISTRNGLRAISHVLAAGGKRSAPPPRQDMFMKGGAL